MSDVYYKVTVTRDNMECTLYWWEKSYPTYWNQLTFCTNMLK